VPSLVEILVVALVLELVAAFPGKVLVRLLQESDLSSAVLSQVNSKLQAAKRLWMAPDPSWQEATLSWMTLLYLQWVDHCM